MSEALTEKQKMLAGLPYIGWDPDILKERKHAKDLCHRFNQCHPNHYKKRNGILAELVNLKGRAHIEPNFWVDYGYNITLGNNFYANHNLTILDVCEVNIGENVFCGPNVTITGATHPLDPIERRNTESGEPIHIGNDVWIGGGAIILPGITVGNGVTIGAGSIVTKDIPDRVVVVGNPAQIVKKV
ncbi:MAG: sugar O-acetyltransferase [Alteromonadaceae bacterium]|nr:sugar O-acetyltransferase [Alteromonadaceae bacterium]